MRWDHPLDGRLPGWCSTVPAAAAPREEPTTEEELA
jgi:hypothetical protein